MDSTHVFFEVVESKSALIEILSRETVRPVVLNSAAEAPRVFYRLTVETGGGQKWKLGLLSEGIGPAPSACKLTGGGLIAVGCDRLVDVLDPSTCAVRASHELDGVFFEFVVNDALEGVLINHELGVLALDARGHRKWSYSAPDVVVQALLDTRMLLHISMEGTKGVVMLDAVTGAKRRA